MFDFIFQGLGYVIRFCYYTIGFESYALALLWFALIVKIVLLPFGIKQQKNQIKGAKLRPKMYAIERKYAGATDRVSLQKKQQEIMDMQQKEGYSPLSGCLPMLIQFPLILVLYRIIQRPLSYICMLGEDVIKALAENPLIKEESAQEIKILGKVLNEGVEKFPELAGVDLPNFDLFGVINLASSPNENFWSWALVIPVVVFASQFFTMKLSRMLNPMMAAQNQTKESQMSMKIMDFAMPAMTLFLAFSLPAALGLYWFFQAILGVAQMLLLAKFMPLPTFTEEELKEAERALRGKGPRAKNNTVAAADPDRPRPRSLHHIDDDDEDYDVQAQRRAPAPQKKATNKNITAAPLKDDRKDDE
ncbi:MAG: membrane protein insertase YidC [Clostridia bacterium]|nr:membrane protein insertase YidC [Clostridia bacterium]